MSSRQHCKEKKQPNFAFPLLPHQKISAFVEIRPCARQVNGMNRGWVIKGLSLSSEPLGGRWGVLLGEAIHCCPVAFLQLDSWAVTVLRADLSQYSPMWHCIHMCPTTAGFLQVSLFTWRDSTTSLGSHLPCPLQCWVEGKAYLPQPASSPNAAPQGIVCWFCHNGTLLAHIQLGVHQDSQSLFHKVESQSLKSLSLNFQRLFLKIHI